MSNILRLLLYGFVIAMFSKAGGALLAGLARGAAATLSLVGEVVLRLFLGLAAGTLVGAVVSLASGGALPAVLAALGSAPFAMLAVWRWRGPLAARLATVRDATVPDHSRRVANWPDSDADVASSWAALMRKLDDGGAQRAALGEAGVACATLLHIADSIGPELAAREPAIAEHALLIRRHVPALAQDMAQAVRWGRGSAANGGGALAAETARTLAGLGRRAGELADAHHARAADMVAARNLHLKRRMGGDDLTDGPE